MKTMKIIILPTIVLISLACSHLDAQTAQDMTKWSDVINNKKLPDIAQSIKSSNPLPWPQLISDASQALKAKELPKPSVLGQLLFEKIRAYENQVSHKEDESEAVAKVYISLSQGLQDSGGYINLCLTDVVNRLAIARLSEILINDPTSADRIKVLLLNSTSLRFSKASFIKMIRNEPAQPLKPEIDLDALQDKDFERQVLAALGLNRGDVFNQYGYNQAGTSTLINGLQIGVLLDRMIVADALINVDALGLVGFLKRGGKYQDLSYDIRSFNAIMKGDQVLYKSDFAQVNRVRVSNLIPFMEEFRNAKASGLIELALQ